MLAVEVVVVIVTYKTADLTIDCLRSIDFERAKTKFRITAVVIDNASGDAPQITAALQANHWDSWAKVTVAPKNGGFAYGNNLGIQQAYRDHRPTYVHLLNPDTRVQKGAIGALVQFLEANPSVGIAGSRLDDPAGSRLSYAFRFPSLLTELEQGLALGAATKLLANWNLTVQVEREPRQVGWVAGASMMIRRTVIDLIGGLDENYFLYFEEVDFCYRAHVAGFPTWCVPDSRVEHISGQSTHVTGLQVVKKPMPDYWFESRRRYFSANYGLSSAVLHDLLAIAAYSLGSFKRLLQGRPGLGTPRFVRGLFHHSVMWSKNRTIPPIIQFKP